MDSDLEFDQTQAVVISDLEDDDLTDDLESSGEKEPCAYLRVLAQRDLPGSSHPVYEGDNIIGRQADTCHVCISSKSLSKEHACIQVVADSHLIFDKGSCNKTRRGKLVLKPEIRYELKHSDVISFADVKCVYEIIKQMSEIVPESDAETDAESDVSGSLHLRHDVTNQSDKLIDLTGEKEDSTDRGVNKISGQQTLVLSGSDSEDDDVPNENSMNNRTAVQETLVFESSDDDDSLDLIGMATQAYTKTDTGKDNRKPGKPSKMIAATQNYLNQAAEELMETQIFDLETKSDEEGTACLRETRSKSMGYNLSKAATDGDSDEHSDDASELFAVSTLVCDYIVDVDDDGSGDEGPSGVVEAIADQIPTSHSSTVAVSSDSTVAVPSDATVDVPSDASVGVKSPSKRLSKKVWSKSVVSPVRVPSLRLAKTLVAEDVVAASEKHSGGSDDLPTQIFDEWSCGSSSHNAAVASGRRLSSDVAGSDGATAPVDVVFPVSGKILAGSRSKAARKCVSTQPTQVFDVISDEPTQAFSAICDEPTQAYGGICDEPTQAYGGICDEPTQAYGGISDEPTQDYSGISDEPTQVFHDIVEKPTQVRGGISNKRTQILDDSSDYPTQILNDSTEKPTQLLNTSSDKPTQVHDDTNDEPTQTFIIDSGDSDEVSVTEKTKSRSNLCDENDQLATAAGGVAAGKQSDKTREDSTRTLTVGDDHLQRRVSDGTVVESDASEEDVDATQAFVDEGEEEGDENYVGKAEDRTQKYVMEAEERLEKAADLANFLKGSTAATSRRLPDSSDDSDLEELSVLKSAETLPDDPAHLFESTSQSQTSLSTNAEPTLRYDMAVDKDPTLPYDMAVDKDPTLPYDMAVNQDPTLPYDMGVEELPGKVKKRQSPKRKKHDPGNMRNGGKELDISADTKKVSDGTNPGTELSAPVIPLPAKSPLKPTLVDRRRSPSPSPGNRRVAFAVTVKEDKVDKQTSPGGSGNTRQSLPSHKSDQAILSPTRPGRSRNKLSLQQTTAIGHSHDDKSQGEIIQQGQSNVTSRVQENLLGVEQSKVGDLDIQGLKSGMNAQTTSIRLAHRTSARRSKVQSAAEDTPPPADDVDPVGSTPPLSEDVNPSGSTPPLVEDVNPSGSTPPLVEGTSKESLTPQAGNRRRKISPEQGDDSTSGKESDNIVVSASKKGRKSAVVTTEKAVDPAGGRRSSARPKRKISYQQLATGVEKKRDKRSAGPSEEAESGGKTAAVNLVHDSSSKASKKSVVSPDDSNTKASKKSAVSLDDSNTKASRKSAVSLDDSNTAAGKKSAVSPDDSNTAVGKKSAVSLDDSNTKASKKSAVSLDDSNTAAGKKSAVSLDDSSTKASKISAVSLDDSNTKARRKSAVSLDDSNTKASRKSAVSLDDSNTRTRRKPAVSLDDSNTKASKKPAASLDDSNTKASKKPAASLDDSNTKASKKSAASLDDSNTKASKKPAASLDDSNTTASKKSAVSLDDSNTAAGKKSAVSLDDSNTTASKKPAVSLDDSNTKASKKPAVSLDDSNTKASKKSAVSLDDSNTKASKKSAVSLDDSNTKASKITAVTLLDDSNTRTSRKSAAPSDEGYTNTSEKPIKPASKKSVQSLANGNTTASEQQSTRRQRPTKQPKENTAKKDSKKTSVRKSARPKTEEKNDNDSDETASIASFVDDSTAIDDETPIRVMDDSSGKDNEQLKTGMTSESMRKSRTTRTARQSDAKEASKKVDNYEVSSDTVSTTSRKRLHSKEPEADGKSHQLGGPSAKAQNQDIHAETRRNKKSVIADDPEKDSSSTAVDSTPTHTEDSQEGAVKNVKSRSRKTVKLDASCETLLSTDSNLPQHDSSRESIGGPTIHQEQTKAGKISRIGTRKSLQVEEKGKGLPQKQVKTQTSHQAVRGKSRKASEVYSQPQTEEIQAPASQGKRATRSLVSSEASVDRSGSDIAQSEAVSSPPQKSTPARKPAHAAVRHSDIKSKGRRSERAEPVTSENDSDKEGHDQNSASQQDKSSQISATQKTKFIHHSDMEKDVSSKNSTNLLKRKRATDGKLSQDGSQSNENKEHIVEQTSTPRAKKSKQTPALRTPPGKVHTENADSPVLRKTSANAKPRVMFTGYLDKQGEKIVRELGGELVTDVQECSHLVTDRICRTVKFLSGLAKGLLIVSPRWLESCKQAGTFVDGHQFLVSDPAMEKQYKFTLAASISKAQAGPLLVGYKVHVTRSVKPDPAQMQDILKFAGAQYMKAMPTKAQEKLVVISCSEDESLCLPAVKAGIPVVGAEFILTGILRQELDFESYSLFQDEPKSQKKTGKKK